MNKYLRWHNYLNFAKRKYLDIKYANSALKIVQTNFEGVKILVLTGAHAILTQNKLRPKTLMIELYDFNLKQYDTSVKDIVEFMSGYDYAAYYLLDSELIRFDPLLHANKIYNVFFKSIPTANSNSIV